MEPGGRRARLRRAEHVHDSRRPSGRAVSDASPQVPRQTRKTLVASSLVRLPLSVAALLLTGTWVQPKSLPLVWAAATLGHGIGRLAFARMDLLRYEPTVLATLVAATLTAIAAAVT